MSGTLRGRAVLLPADPPRASRLALVPADRVEGTEDVTLVERPGTSRHTVRARVLPVGEAVPALVDPERYDAGSETLRFFSAAATVALHLVARGRLLPGVTEGRYDTWHVGPLDADDQALVDALVEACPPEAHAVPVRGTRVATPRATVHAFLDAVADTMVRTAAAPLAVTGPAYAVRQAVDVSDLARWLADAGQSLETGIRAGLRLETTGDEDSILRAVIQLRSRADAAIVADAAELWSDPARVLGLLGPSADGDLLRALRRGAMAWPPLESALAQRTPTSIDLDDEAVADLLGTGADALAAAGVELLWPRELLSGALTVRAVTTSPPADAAPTGGFSLDRLLEFRWEIALDGEPLSEEEFRVIADAKRPFVRLRGRWVRVEPGLLDRMRNRTTSRVSGIEALAASLNGSIVLDGETVEFRTSGALLNLTERLRDLAARREDAGTGAPPERLDGTLRQYQLRGLDWLAEMADLGLGGCLADDMGLGKTVQVIALHLRRHERDPRTGPTLVVCPTTLLGNWEREIRRFAPGTEVRRFHGGDRHLEAVGSDEVVLATYGLVRRDREALAEVAWDLVVADEAQAVKNPLSRTARELRALPSNVRVALTGTPVENRLTDLWSILDWTTPGLLGPLERFRREVAIPVERYHDREATERVARIVRPFVLRRRKSDPGIAPELPPKTETDRFVPLTTEQATLYEAVVRDTLDAIRQASGIGRRGLVLKLLTALKQVCNHPAHFLGQAGPLEGRSGKLAALDELLDVIVAEGDSVLVFSQYVTMGRLLEKHLAARDIGTLFLHGNVPARTREEMVDTFQAGGVPVFLLSLKAGGQGLNLTRATHVIHYDRWWNPAVEDQATDRAHRIGQDRPVQVHRLMAEGTLEDRIGALMERKRVLADAVVGGGEGWVSELSDAELAELVALRDPS
jgi:hypothetical protein